MSGKLWERKRIIRYYLQRWPSVRSMKRARARVKALTGRSQVGMELRAVIGRLNLFLRGWGNYFRTGNAADKFRCLDRHVGWPFEALAHQEARPQPEGRSGSSLVGGLVPRPGPAQAHGHYPLPQGCVTMSRRPSLSRVRENRTHGLKGEWGTGLATAPRP